MMAPFQVQIEQVTPARHFYLREAIGPIETAIQEAWATTRRQIDEADYEPRIAQTGFAQLLVHNVRNEVFRLGETPGEVETYLLPNRRRTSHHVLVRFRNFWITVSAVRSRKGRPRPARFRMDYARRQMSFVVNQDNNDFEPAPPPEATEGDVHTYIQMLHGPTPGNRQTHGFTLIAFINRFGEYGPAPVEITEFLDPDAQQVGEVPLELIGETIGIEIN